MIAEPVVVPPSEVCTNHRAGSTYRIRLARQVDHPVRVDLSAGLRDFELAKEAARLATQAGFDKLIALPLVREMEPLEHQIRTVKTVLRRFRGRALLCDEVGLGKTVEAGLILSELMIQGLVRSGSSWFLRRSSSSGKARCGEIRHRAHQP